MCETNPEPVCVSKLGTDQTPRRAHPSTEIRSYSILILAFTASRLLYYSAGVRYDARPLQDYFQIIEPDLLQNRLIESLYYFHVQPPGFNLWIGLILKLFPTAYTGALHTSYLLCGVAITITLYSLMRFLQIRPAIALGFTCAFVVSPGVVLFENYLLYEFPTKCFLCAAAFMLYQFFHRRNDWFGLGFLICVLGLLMMRNQFHLVYFAAALWFIWYYAVSRPPVLLAGGLLFGMALGCYVKNWVLFNKFESSTWMGMNISAITIHQLTGPEARSLVDSGVISPISLVPVMSELDSYRPYIRTPPKTGIPVLDRERKASGAPNLNNLAYLQVQDLYLKDGIAILKHYPRAYLRSVAIAWFTYFLPPGDFPFFDVNRAHIWTLDRLYNICVFGQFRDASNRKALRTIEAAGGWFSLLPYTGIFMVVGLPGLWGFGVWQLLRGLRTLTLTRAQIALLAFILINIAYVTAVSNFLGCFENNRYRFPLDGFYVLLAALVVNYTVDKSFSTRATERSVRNLYPTGSETPAYGK